MESFARRREKNLRRGGGLQILMRKRRGVEMEEVRTRSEEVLCIEGVCFGLEMRMVLAYFDVRRDEEGRQNNQVIREEMERLIEENEKEGVIVLGDFNGHLEELDGKKDDMNGKMIRSWVEEYDLTLMNGDDKCEGVFTWMG